MKELSKKYDSKLVEEGKYKTWIEREYFKAGDLSKQPYSIVIPPPNVTGKLHLGHAWDNTLQDIIMRYQRLLGKDVLYLPGMDHAGIATQARVDEKLRSQGTSAFELGREKFLEVSWDWKEEYAAHIREQWSKLGLSLDYSRERFTLDDGLNEAVRKVFVDLYNDGLIFQGYRIINWDVEAKTALSNIEVEHKEVEGNLYTFKYKVVETGEDLLVATTRPETMFGDVCLVVHPDDARYTHVVGKHAINPANGDVIPIITDDYIDIEFGTGVMKCTPAHDPNDFMLGEKYGLEMPIIMNPNGTMNELTGKYNGMDRFEARKALVSDIEAAGNCASIEKHVHQVGHSERTNAIIEPYLSKQWFVKMEPLAREVLKHQETRSIEFYPERFSHTFNQWLENIEDWCISRQLWWGHRIPAWFHKETEEIYVGMEAPEDIENWTQDEDVLDTWFSSALWPFSTMGWPHNTVDLERYYPTDVMVTGYDIIFFWVARMAFQARYFMKNAPFKDVLIHGLIRAEDGRKMSKSLDNGIDPMDVIEEYGVDALRFFLTTNSTPGQDMRYSATKVESAWNFINKIWNASRFVMMHLDGQEYDLDKAILSSVDRYILDRFNKALAEISANMDKYEYANVGNALTRFIWDDFANEYLELSKTGLQSEDEAAVYATKATLSYILKSITIMMAPFTPFVSEEIYTHLPGSLESINLERWPEAVKVDTTDLSEVSYLLNSIDAIRETRASYDIKPSKVLSVQLLDTKQETYHLSQDLLAMLASMAKLAFVEDIEEPLLVGIEGGALKLDKTELVDKEALKVKLEAEKKKLFSEIKRCEGMLANENFVSKAPETKIKEEREKLAEYKRQMDLVIAQLVEYE